MAIYGTAAPKAIITEGLDNMSTFRLSYLFTGKLRGRKQRFGAPFSRRNSGRCRSDKALAFADSVVRWKFKKTVRGYMGVFYPLFD